MENDDRILFPEARPKEEFRSFAALDTKDSNTLKADCLHAVLNLQRRAESYRTISMTALTSTVTLEAHRTPERFDGSGPDALAQNNQPNYQSQKLADTRFWQRAQRGRLRRIAQQNSLD